MINSAGFCSLRSGFPRVQFYAYRSGAWAQSLFLIFQRGLAARQALVSLSLSGSDRIRNMFHRVLPHRWELIAMPKAPRASDEALDAPTPTLCHTNVETTAVLWVFS